MSSSFYSVATSLRVSTRSHDCRQQLIGNMPQCNEIFRNCFNFTVFFYARPRSSRHAGKKGYENKIMERGVRRKNLIKMREKRREEVKMG